MKKVATILIALSFLNCVSGCDFLRRVAGRPTGAQVEEIAVEIKAAQEARLARERAEEEAAIKAEAAARDSAYMASIAATYGVKFSEQFAFGTPSSAQLGKYNVIVGVYRYVASASSQISFMLSRGYDSFDITFPDGGYAVCMGSCGNLEQLDSLLLRSEEDKSRPKDAWIYVNNL